MVSELVKLEQVFGIFDNVQDKTQIHKNSINMGKAKV